MYFPLGAKAIIAASKSCFQSKSVLLTKLRYSGSSLTLEPSSNCRIPPLRKRPKSMYSTIASSVGRRLSKAAGERTLDRYQITPQSVPPHSTKMSTISSHARVLGVTTEVSHSRQFAGARFVPQPDIRPQFAHHPSEIGQRERLRSVADCLLRARMDLDDQAVGSNRHARARERRNQTALARGVAGIENHRQV